MYPFGSLSGSGVAFKLAWALCKLACGSDKVSPVFREFLLDCVSLAALGTVADVVPLAEENRILVRYGLARLRSKPTLGIKALLDCAGLADKPVLASMDIGFGLAPRLNAAGRLSTARLAVELLMTNCSRRAGELARYLEEQNRQRQILERHILDEARALADECNGDPALVLAGSNWHPGLIGIVASRLVDLYHRPVLLIALREGQVPAAGSGRSIAGLLLHEALEDCTTLLTSHGGHAQAAGFRIDPARVDSFRARFQEAVRRRLGSAPQVPVLVLDAEVPLAALTAGLVRTLQQLEPYGSGNPEPLFLAGDLQISGTPRKVGGDQRHLSFRVRQRGVSGGISQGREMRAIAFGMADRAEELMSLEGCCCLAFRPRLNDWNGFSSVELEVCDFQAGARAHLG
jgi:single-stranded-DNA-specific exonuclease